MTKSELIAEAVALKDSGKYNCAQSVACAFAEEVGVSREEMEVVARSFGVGMGCMEATCGAIIGAGIILGVASANRVQAMQSSAEILRAFQKRNGATICRQLEGVSSTPPRPLRACRLCVADAAEFLYDQLHK